MSESASEHWSRVYSTKAVDAVSWYQLLPGTSLDLIAKSVRPPASVIDIGAGASYLADHLLELDYRVALLDVAAPALQVVRDRLGERAARVSWFVEDVLQFVPPVQWDVWHDRAVFHFLVDEAARKTYLRVLDAATRAGSFVIMATFGPEGPEKCSGLPVRRYSPAQLQNELGNHYKLVEDAWETHTTPSGGQQQFVYCRFQRGS